MRSQHISPHLTYYVIESYVSHVFARTGSENNSEMVHIQQFLSWTSGRAHLWALGFKCHLHLSTTSPANLPDLPAQLPPSEVLHGETRHSQLRMHLYRWNQCSIEKKRRNGQFPSWALQFSASKQNQIISKTWRYLECTLWCLCRYYERLVAVIKLLY